MSGFIYELHKAVMTIFKYTSDTVYEQQSVRIARDSFLESWTGNEASFFLCDSTNMFQCSNFGSRKQEGGGGGARRTGEVGSCQS